MNQRNIFLVEGDNDARPAFRKELKKFGYQVRLAVDEEDALERVQSRDLKVDLMLIGLPTETPAKILEVARNISHRGQLDVPIVVMASSYGADLEGEDVQVSEKEYITYIEEPNQLSNLLARLLSHA